jgi:hypothetical protein
MIRRSLFPAACGIAGLLLSLCLHAQAPSPTPEWRPFESAEGRFKASFPGMPVVRRGKLRSGIGDIATTRHTAGDGVDTTYDVTYNDYPKEHVATLSAAILLETVRDGLVLRAKGHLKSDRPVTLGKVPGREIEITGEDGMVYRIRLLLAGTRMYQLTAMARAPARPQEKKLFDSFQLTREAP